MTVVEPGFVGSILVAVRQMRAAGMSDFDIASCVCEIRAASVEQERFRVEQSRPTFFTAREMERALADVRR